MKESITMSDISLVSYAVRDASGSFDLEATVEKFRGDCLRYAAARETEDTEIGEAVRAAFGEVALGGSLNMPYLQSKVLQALNAQSANFKALQDRTANWVREHAQGESIKNDKGEATGVERPDSEFVIGKGKGGGVHVRADRATRDAAIEAAKSAKKAL